MSDKLIGKMIRILDILNFRKINIYFNTLQQKFNYQI